MRKSALPGLLLALLLPPASAPGAEEARYWLENALADHGFTFEEAGVAAGLSAAEAERRAGELGIKRGVSPRRPAGEALRILPYPGGRHPRIGFLDGAIDPRRETKASVFLPWEDGGYVVVDLPEAVFSGADLLYLAHTHIPTVWDRKKVAVPRTEWRRGGGGELRCVQALPDGTAIGARITPRTDGADLELWIRNSTDRPLPKLRAQVCALLKGARGFEAQTNDNKFMVKLARGEAMAARSSDGRRWLVMAWEASRAWANPPCPCLHSDPTFPDCPPGGTVVARGRLRVGESAAGTVDLEVEIRRLDAEGKLFDAALGVSAARIPAGASAAEIAADDSMVIGGGIGPGAAVGQEGKLRAAAVVLGSGRDRLALVACDVLMVNRDYLDQAARRIEAEEGIPFENVLINATHTHHAPSTVTIHGYARDETFCGRMRDAIVEAVKAARRRLEAGGPCELVFARGEETTVGQNSRLLLSDGSIFWVGPREDAVRSTGPFDPDLPVVALRRPEGALEAILFNHSTHCIGTREVGKRSPGFYGLAAQDLEAELGGTAVFLAGAFGSSHNLTLKGGEAASRIATAVRAALSAASPRSGAVLRARKKEVAFRVRDFDEAREDAAVEAYCRKRTQKPEYTIEVFRKMRAALATHRGEERKTWVQALRIGDLAVVGLPGELFTRLGVEIKRRSPLRNTFVAGVANDYIGYIPDAEAYDLGGYQVWTGLHSFVARGTGEMLVEEALGLLEELNWE